jgi:arginyl-tRNA synthetase
MFKEEVVKLLQKATKLSGKEVDGLLEVPPDPRLGDLAFPCFALAKKLKKDPKKIAEDIKSKIKLGGWISRVECAGPYLNFFVSNKNLAEEVLKEIWKKKGKYGGKSGKQVAMVEFCHANTHKAIHIGHFRNLSLGESFARLLEFSGYKVYRVTYGGDIGPHVAKCLWAYLKYHQKHDITNEKRKGTWLGKLYSEGASRYKESEKIRKEVTDLTGELYAGEDKQLMALLKKTKKWSVDELKDVLNDVGIKFDDMIWESEVSQPGLEMSKDLLKRGIAEKSEGAIVLNLEKYGLGVWVLVTGGGYPLYSAKDLGLAKLKSKKYEDLDLSIHVVASEQDLHFKQLFKTFELIGFTKFLKKSHHLSYELVMLKSGKISSRAGGAPLYWDLSDSAKKITLREVKKRNPKMNKKQLEDIANKIAVSALKFAMLKQSPNKVIRFDWDEALSFEGDSGPYLQYTLVRANRILEKAGIKPKVGVDFSLLKTDQEKELIKVLAKFPEVINRSVRRYEPYLIASYALDLAAKFSSFYEAIPLIIKSSKEERDARLLLVWCFIRVLKNCLYLMNMEEVDRM